MSASLWSVADPSHEPRTAIEVASATSQLPLLWITALNEADLPTFDAGTPATLITVDLPEACLRMQQRAKFLDATLGAGSIVAGYAQLLIDALKSAGQPRIEIDIANLVALDNTLLRRLAVAVHGLEQQQSDVSFEMPPVIRMNPFTHEEMPSPPRALQGLRAVLSSIADFDRRTRVPTVHRYLTGEALEKNVLLNVERLIGVPVGVNTPWRQVVERRGRRK